MPFCARTTHVTSFVHALRESDFKDSLPMEEIDRFMRYYLKEGIKLQETKAQYEQVLGKKPSGNKSNNIEWLKAKIDEFDRPKTELELLKEEYAEKLGKKPRGNKSNNIEWLKAKIYEFDRPKTERELLKEEYAEKLGKKPRGPNTVAWLKAKISEYDSRSDEEIELQETKSKFEQVFGKKPSGNKSNNIEWLKAKIGESSDEEDEVGVIKFKFEGVSYTRTFDYPEKSWKVTDDEGFEVGEWDEDSEGILWDDKCWMLIHQDHDDYTEA